MGKSRLARTALDRAAEQGAVTHWITGTSWTRTLPLGALAGWAGPASDDSLELVRDLVDTLCWTEPGLLAVIGVDDVHYLDELSIFVMHQILQRANARLVLTLREGIRVTEGVHELCTHERLDRIDLRPMSAADSSALVAAALDGPLDPDADRKLWQLTRGNPLYLRNIVEHEVAQQRLVRTAGRWRWIGEPVVPPGLAALIDERVGTLPAQVGEVVDVVAVGEPLDLDVLARITDPGSVEEADLRGLITLESADGRVRVRMAHPLYGEVRRSRVAPTRLRRLRGLICTELAAEEGDDVHVIVQRAALSVDSNLPPDPDLLLRGALAAAWLIDLPLAEHLAEAATRTGAGPDAALFLGFLLSWMGRGEDADTVLESLRSHDLSPFEQGHLTFLQSVNTLVIQADPAAAQSRIDSLDDNEQTRMWTAAYDTVHHAAAGHAGTALAAAEQFDWAALADPVAQRLTAWAGTVALGESGRTAAAVKIAEAAHRLPVRAFAVGTDAHVEALLLAGSLTAARVTAGELLQRQTTDPRFNQLARALLGRAVLATGDLEGALAHLAPAVAALAGSDNAWWYRYQIPLALALAQLGRVDEADSALDALDAHPHPGLRFLEYEHAVAQAWATALRGAVSVAVGTVRNAADAAATQGQFAAEVWCLQVATQFGDPSAAARLTELTDLVEGPRVLVAARYATALQNCDAVELTGVSTQFEQLGDLIGALDAAAHAALAYRAADLRGSALSCITRAQQLAGRCGGASTPTLRLVAQPLPLTGREREVVALLGDGLSNREIARRLQVSVRTVESHIYRAMAKTGVNDRDGLARLLDG